jgi:hypothetical protein
VYLKETSTYNNAIRMPPFMAREFLPGTKAARTYVDTLLGLAAARVCTFDANGMGKITSARIARNIDFWLI